MVGELEAAGDLMTGAALARAVEPSAGEHGGHAPSCMNCGAKLHGGHCHVCGQKGDVHRTIGAFWHDFTHSILHFEGKIWRTLPLLFFKPGELTRRYVHGERARFVSPLALFLFSIFLMFAVFSWVGGPFKMTGDAAAAQAEMAQESAALSAQIARLKTQRSELANKREATAAVDARLDDLRRQKRALQATRSIVLVPNNAPDRETTTINLKEAQIETGLNWLDHGLEKARANPQLLLYKMQSNAYKFSWALVLLSLPFVWLAFAWRRQFHVFDHLVFVTYSLCFATLVLVFLSFTVAIGIDFLVTPMLLIGFPLHLFAQLRGAYTLSIPGALWRTIYLLIAAAFVLLLFGMLLLAIGAG